MTITPERRVTDFGEGDYAPITPIENAVFDLAPPSSSITAVGDGDGGKPYMQDGSLFVPRGSDLKDGDRVSFQGKTFGIVGDARWDMDSPFPGAVSQSLVGRYVEFALRLGG